RVIVLGLPRELFDNPIQAVDLVLCALDARVTELLDERPQFDQVRVLVVVRLHVDAWRRRPWTLPVPPEVPLRIAPLQGVVDHPELGIQIPPKLSVTGVSHLYPLLTFPTLIRREVAPAPSPRTRTPHPRPCRAPKVRRPGICRLRRPMPHRSRRFVTGWPREC